MKASDDQHFRGFGAVIVYRGHTLWRSRGENERRSAWFVFAAKPELAGTDPCGEARTFEAACRLVDERIAALKAPQRTRA
jgi:hypothetical protein